MLHVDLVVFCSGGQYDCGTTDVTRTFHLGEPTARQRECFTRVLQVSTHSHTAPLLIQQQLHSKNIIDIMRMQYLEEPMPKQSKSPHTRFRRSCQFHSAARAP